MMVAPCGRRCRNGEVGCGSQGPRGAHLLLVGAGVGRAGGAKGQQLPLLPRTHGLGEVVKEKKGFGASLSALRAPSSPLPPCPLILPWEEREQVGMLWSWQVLQSIKEKKTLFPLLGESSPEVFKLVDPTLTNIEPSPSNVI